MSVMDRAREVGTGARKPYRNRWMVVSVGLLLVGQIIAGCGGKKADPPKSPGGDSGTKTASYAGMENIPAIKNASSEQEKNRIADLIRGARQEGALNWYGVQIEPQQAEKALPAFRTYYGLDDVKTEYTYASPGEVVTKVEELLRAKRDDVDVVWNSSYGWFMDLQKKNLLMEYDSPEYATYSVSQQQGASSPKYWVSDFYTFTPMYNAKLMVKTMGANWKPKSWKDFTDPKLKGILSIGDVMNSTSHAQTMQGIFKVLGRGYFEELAKQVEPVTFNRSAQGRDWVATGEYPVTFSSHAKNTETLRTKGNDGIMLVYPEEGSVLLPFTLVILKNAKHPNASKLFVDFARSVYGQETLLKAGALNFPGRTGVKTPVPELLPPIEQLKLVPMDWNKEGTNEAIAVVRKMWQEIGLGR